MRSRGRVTGNDPMRPIPDNIRRNFQRKIFRFYEKHGRTELPFRNTTDPYAITVSEVMLQQTQVERVLPKYETWLSRWPDFSALAGATQQEVLSAWSGLGYNRRAVFLWKLAQAVVSEYDGRLPSDPRELQTLPGIGEYTSRAILIFAYNRPLAAIDTNIRRVLIHELSLDRSISMPHLQQVAGQVLPKRRAREWHYALMDYSRLALSRMVADIAPLTRQSKFEGSIRQIRGEIVRRLTRQRSVRLSTVARSLQRELADVERAVAGLEKDGLVRRNKDVVELTSG